MRWLSGILVFLVPYAVCAGLTVAVGAANGIMTPHAAAESACAAAGAILAYMVIYHTAVLASVLTGQTVTGLLAAVAIAVYPTVVFSLASYLKGTFFEAYTGTEAALSDVLMELASPIGLFNRLTLGLRGGGRRCGCVPGGCGGGCDPAGSGIRRVQDLPVRVSGESSGIPADSGCDQSAGLRPRGSVLLFPLSSHLWGSRGQSGSWR